MRLFTGELQATKSCEEMCSQLNQKIKSHPEHGVKVTVLMSVYNGERHLEEAIDSILQQTFTDFELLIINDGSTDRSVEILQGYDDQRLRVVHNEKNLGLTRSLNRGIDLALGEYIAHGCR